MLDAYAKDKADKSFTFPTTNYQLGLAEKETSGWFNPLDDSDMTKYLKSGLTQFTSESRPGSGITVIEQMGRIARKENPTDRELSQLKIGQDYLKDLYKEANQKGWKMGSCTRWSSWISISPCNWRNESWYDCWSNGWFCWVRC